MVYEIKNALVEDCESEKEEIVAFVNSIVVAGGSYKELSKDEIKSLLMNYYWGEIEVVPTELKYPEPLPIDGRWEGCLSLYEEYGDGTSSGRQPKLIKN